MKKMLDSLSAYLIIATFVVTFVFVCSAAVAQTPASQSAPGNLTPVSPPGGNLPVQPHNPTTANAALSSTPSSGVVNTPTAATTPAATTPNGSQVMNNPNSGTSAATPNANSAQNTTPATGQTPAQGAAPNGNYPAATQPTQ